MVEADESDRSLLKLNPTIAVVTNAELDHHTTYASSRDVDDTFTAFLALAEQRRRPARAAPPRTRTPADVRAAATIALERPRRAQPAQRRGRADGDRAWPGETSRAAARRLATFEGAGRRFEDVGTFNGARVVDDYAHHPTEVRATIAAARTLEPAPRVALFQPHLFSRTQREARAFGQALAAADLAVVLDIYPARENAEDYPGVTGLLVAEAAADAGDGKRVAWVQATTRRPRLPAPRAARGRPAADHGRRRRRTRIVAGTRRGRSNAARSDEAPHGSGSPSSPCVALLAGGGWMWLRDSASSPSATSRSPA